MWKLDLITLFFTIKFWGFYPRPCRWRTSCSISHVFLVSLEWETRLKHRQAMSQICSEGIENGDFEKTVFLSFPLTFVGDSRGILMYVIFVQKKTWKSSPSKFKLNLTHQNEVYLLLLHIDNWTLWITADFPFWQLNNKMKYDRKLLPITVITHRNTETPLYLTTTILSVEWRVEKLSIPKPGGSLWKAIFPISGFLLWNFSSHSMK